MGKWLGDTVYIDREPNNPDKGWGWVEVTVENIKRFGIPTYPEANDRILRRF